VTGSKKVIGELCEAEILVSLDGTLFMESSRYREYARAVAGTAKPGAVIGISEAKDSTRLSRKWIIPVLNRMERDGFLKREGELRRVLRIPN
jgi:selenocysteine-specific elongation factor